ncbi:MAG: DUF1778 domain-containing protein [Desulfovibrio sp.]|nr:DUF1778 domain-containing protein [Desulfovibrio sp.]
MKQVQEARCRIDIRVPLSVRNMIDRASSLQGRTRTDFIIATLVEKAKAMIEEETVIRLSLRDQELLANSLLYEEPKEPTQFMKDLMQEYEDRVESK